jgi:putative ABC transport system permease protein
VLFWTTVKISFKSLFANKLRSFLAMLGIIIGVSSVIAMLAIASGVRQDTMDRIAQHGTDLLVVRPRHRRRGGVATENVQELTVDDAREILKVEGVLNVSPVVRTSGQAVYYNKNTRTTIMGTAPTYLQIRSFQLASGRMFTDVETNRLGRVAVLGSQAAENLFETKNPLGETIRVSGINFEVIGVLSSKGDQGWFNPDDQILMPYKTVMRRLMGTRELREIDVQAVNYEALTKMEKDIKGLLRSRYPSTGEEDGFYVRNQADIIETASEVNRTFTFLLGGIASIALLVGGIGIMNIMLVTVTERTREIGVRKAIGARRRDILTQFLLESVLMTGLGGLMGVLVGMGVAFGVDSYTEFSTVVEPLSVVIALSFAGGVGLFFGYYPARRAANLNPIEALRYE